TAKFDLTLSLAEGGGRLLGAVEYNTDLFEEPTAVRLAEHFLNLARSAAAGPGRRVGRLEMLSAEERRQLLYDWNETGVELPPGATIPALFGRRAASTPDSVALLFGDERVSYAQLNGRANRLARRLREMGVGPEVLVGLCVERSVEMVVGLLGILKAGGAYVPLDPEYPRERLSFMLSDSMAAVLLTQSHLLDSLPAHSGVVFLLDEQRGELDSYPSEDFDPGVGPDSLAYVIYTSGSTGTPKGVAVTHRGVARLVLSPSYVTLGPAEVLLQLAPLAFDASTFEIWGALLNGARLALMPPGRHSLAELGAELRRRGVTTLWLTAGLFHLMAAERMGDLRGVRQLLAGGDVLSPQRVRGWLEGAPEGAALINGYGPTENTTFTCCHRMEAGGGAGWAWGSVPVGRPIGGTRVYVLDAGGRPAAAGVAGELYAGGEGVARGYLSRPALTAERFVPDPFSGEAGARLYRTGDVVRWRGGGLMEFVGRLDGQVKVRGFRIELGEIEAALSECAGVRECVVVARAGDDAGGGEAEGGGKRLVAYVVADDAALPPTAARLRERLRERVPEYMVPSAFVLLDSLP
ncbi:MAG TPA: amino acid adenylation domain-containing protein, partial [Solirubrobacterales bacterium]|nr:amino acid adenylation domain-containing protein [Solirubrobacterales bacterium]